MFVSSCREAFASEDVPVCVPSAASVLLLCHGADRWACVDVTFLDTAGRSIVTGARNGTCPRVPIRTMWGVKAMLLRHLQNVLEIDSWLMIHLECWSPASGVLNDHLVKMHIDSEKEGLHVSLCNTPFVSRWIFTGVQFSKTVMQTYCTPSGGHAPHEFWAALSWVLGDSGAQLSWGADMWYKWFHNV